MISGKAAARPRFGRPVLILPAVVALFALSPALGQETIYIGGSGQTSVEIDLGALDHRYEAPRPIVFGLRHPGDSGGNLAPVKLRPPSDTPTSTKTTAPVETAAIEAPQVEMVTKLEPPPATVSPEIVSSAEEITEPAPAPVAETDPDKMTAEERAAAVARNKNMVSSTSFANEAARSSGDNESPAKAAEKPAQKSTAKPAQKTEMAALDPADVPTLPGQSMQITFAAGEAVLPDGAHVPLAAIADMLANDDTLRLQLKAYAGGGADSASHARRLSLSRALAVRSQLIEQGVRSTRIDVRALGNKSESGTSDRVDVILVQR